MSFIVKITFFFFSLIFVGQMILPTSFWEEYADLMETVDDLEQEEDSEEETDEIDVKLTFDTTPYIKNQVPFISSGSSNHPRLGELSKGERIIFSPPPDLLT